jgi:ubiquinone/menaquinone biosynthesis C-methylase UbiE
MGMGGADWLERPERELEEQPGKALAELNLKPGMAVADVGAGVGYFTVRMAKLVSPGGKVFAVDVQPEMLTRLKRRAKRAGIDNIDTVLGAEADPHLPDNSCDMILLVDVYHEFSQPQVMLQKMRQALKPTGKLVLLEYRKEDPSVPIRLEHKMSIWEVRTELEAEGYKLEKVLKTLPRQHIFILSPNKS